jgi:phosphopantothenoylcysteine decarboxylase/phosphopantothenate--cysteine ligase
MLTGKKILLAVTGSIAAYKTAFLVRLLVKEGAEVRVIMTDAAKDFIPPLTLSTLSKNPVESSYFDPDTGAWSSHVELGLWPDLMLVAPLSANTLAKFAHGLCDNLLCATYLSARCPVMLAPAMDLDMYQHPSTAANLRKLKAYGHIVIDATYGELASGLEGKGRMAEPEEILERVKAYFQKTQLLAGKRVLITSGPTQEAVDPVRYISNHSSGKMGKALAEACVEGGAQVFFVSGPSQVWPEANDRLEIVKVRSAQEMLAASEKFHEDADVVIFAAAVADYRPAKPSDQKIKKDQNSRVSLELVRNPDIAASLGEKKKHQWHVGFALETQDGEKAAKEKMHSKHFDMVVLNSLEDAGAGFAHDTNKVAIFDRDNNVTHTELISKEAIAWEIVAQIAKSI